MPPASCLNPRATRIIPNPNPNPNRNGCRCPLTVTARRPHRRNHSNCSSPAFFLSPLPQSLIFSRYLAISPSLCTSNSDRYLSCMQRSKCSVRYAVLGAGFAGLSVAWHLLKIKLAMDLLPLVDGAEESLCYIKHNPKESRICIDIYDEAGIGGGASGASGGLLHPYSPKGKVLWRGAECWKECLELLTTAERAVEARVSNSIAQDTSCDFDKRIVLRRGIIRPATTEKNVEILKENAQNCLQNCTLEVLDSDAAQFHVPDLCVPFNSAVYMPLALNIHHKRYLQALFLACQYLADVVSKSDCEEREINLYEKPVHSLHELAGEYNAVIICLGAKVDMLPELSGKLPLRTCRGVIAQLQLPSDIGGEYDDGSPSILSDAWLAFQGPRSVLMGSTWDWGSKNYSSNVSTEEASRAFAELLPKASAFYPAVSKWAFGGARAGLRAMPPSTPLGSLPLLGCVDDAVEERERVGCRYWLIGGLGSRGLLYHGLLGKLMAQAVISSDENVLPSELTSWKKIKLWKTQTS